MKNIEKLSKELFIKLLLDVGDDDEEAYNKLVENSRQVADSAGRSLAEMRYAILEWVCMGYSAMDATYLVRVTILGLNALSLGVSEVVSDIKGIMVAFNIAPVNSMKALGVLVMDRGRGI